MEMTWQGMHVSITTNLSHLIQGIASQQRYAVGNPFLVGGLWTTLLRMVACGQTLDGVLQTSFGIVAFGQALEWWLGDKPRMVVCEQALEWWSVDNPLMVAHGQVLEWWLEDKPLNGTGLGWWPVNKPWMVACEQALDGGLWTSLGRQPVGKSYYRAACLEDQLWKKKNVGSWMGKISGGSWVPSGKTEDQNAIGNV